ncbi:hypothetical protein B0H19DRAFT_1139214 [Mycena capillaripes]|nr:hypothetical protein B0H19DRAFT_1139214 [Mycena capillaripes]
MQDDNSNISISEARRVQELWFEDGNLVIQAGNSLYRVFRGILARASPIFQDMLSLPQPPDSDLVEGCLIVRLPDPETEVTPFLKAIFDSSSFMPHPAVTTYDTVVGVLRLSNKYEVDYLRRRAVVHLSSGYPTTLAVRDAGMVCSWNKMVLVFRGAAAVIQLARELDALWILPYAFYLLAHAFDGEVSSKTFIEHAYTGDDYTGVQTDLSSHDRRCFFHGFGAQKAATHTNVLRFLCTPLDIPGCAHPRKCARNRLVALSVTGAAALANPLDVWREWDWTFGLAVCSPCLIVLKKTHQEARQAFWDVLPTIYGLPPWEELENMKAAAIGGD